ncbi:hypothetical protein [Rhodocista pekingensis]|uniref:Uncharacterized protein n=1 Tax=Rhodocista pekingensis TaxID=201185 RepID=A0ABW2KXK8_9PROT
MLANPFAPNYGDNATASDYRRFMESGTPYLVLKLDTTDPIEIGDFVASFTALASQYEKFIRAHHPDLAPDVSIYVKEVRAGCIEAEFIPWAIMGVATLIGVMDKILILEDFIKRWGKRLSPYWSGEGRDEEATKSDISDWMGQVASIAKDPDASARLSCVTYEKDERKERLALEFDTTQARNALDGLRRHKKALEHVGGADYEKVLMVFQQSNTKDAAPGKRTSERVVINKITSKDLPLIYVSDVAAERIKFEIREASDNIYRKGFWVDVNVETRPNGTPIAFRITGYHGMASLDNED